jgi:hypothetical protein
VLGPKQSWTDLLTNETFVHPLNDLVEPADLIRRSIPFGAVPSLLHEAAHHTCLASAVGLALAATDMKARRLAESEEDEGLGKASAIVLTNRAVIELYRPLLEGLALFAEFDSLPSSSRILSRPLLYAARHTSGPEKASKWELELLGTLTKARLTRASIDRRRDVLSTGLADPGGYQLGYLYVRTWGRWASQMPIFRDPDFIFFFLSEYFWNDYELAALLLEEHAQDPLLPSKPILEYCLKRLTSVLSDETAWEETATYFEQAMLDYNLGPSIAPGFHLGPPSLPGEAQKAGRRQLQEFLTSLPLDDAQALARRSMFHLVSLPVKAELHHTSNGPRLAVTFRGKLLLVAKPDDSYRGTGGFGTFDMFMESATKEPCVAVTVEGELAHLYAPGQHADFIAQWGQQFPLARGTSGFEPAMVAISKQDGGRLSKLWASFVSSFRKAALAAYSRVGLAWIEPEGKGHLLRQPAGFRSLLGVDLTESLAILASIENNQAYLEEVTPKKIGDELRTAAIEIEQRLKPLGIEPISLWTEQDEEGRDRTAILVRV